MKHIVVMLMLCLGVLAVLCPGCVSPDPPDIPVQAESTGDDLAGVGELVFVTEEYPPFNYVEDGRIRGIAVDLLIGVLRQMDGSISTYRIQVLPWPVAYQAALTGENTAIFATVRLPEREHLFKWAGPLGSERKVIFADPDREIELAGPRDLVGYRIGVVEDDAAYLQLLALGVDPSKLVTAGDVPSLVAMMQEGDIDLWCYGDLAGRHFTGKVTGDPYAFEIVYTLASEDLYFAFNPTTPDSVVAAFQEALDNLRNQPDPSGVTGYQRIMYRYLGVSCLAQPPVTEDQVTGLVNFTVRAIENDAPGTLARINAGEHPFWDRENRALYVFVYDTSLTIVAEADNPLLVGVNMQGKTDIAGTPFRDRIREKALAKGSGWVEYIWMIPEENGIYTKSAYFRLVTGSDGIRYIVASGMYTPCG